jgi:hypothetical protein
LQVVQMLFEICFEADLFRILAALLIETRYQDS